ncbi:hypothetical protein BIFGAL_03293 [Bifidobacterium gallicum DSM 20093 = LMG 11596]|uniref:Uncharacterized protein n=1 Tax=Bifidobacterium gallicum DSM 20093 = LMG 11596 TaxID=561180 RepID=D1NTX2_9BIFI|nr:hypothetical protein BIFGAL_03293 [Bifidobacterium gallicum DSM 20093 = LMG 11596]
MRANPRATTLRNSGNPDELPELPQTQVNMRSPAVPYWCREFQYDTATLQIAVRCAGR